MKFKDLTSSHYDWNVTPYAGVWIEILQVTVSLTFVVVTPYAGVWIEIILRKLRKVGRCWSLPTRECGLKSQSPICNIDTPYVTPYAGVWIEICSSITTSVVYTVTPYAGVWIEISEKLFLDFEPECHSLRGSVD